MNVFKSKKFITSLVGTVGLWASLALNEWIGIELDPETIVWAITALFGSVIGLQGVGDMLEKPARIKAKAQVILGETSETAARDLSELL